jgi:hypothetical protein
MINKEKSAFAGFFSFEMKNINQEILIMHVTDECCFVISTIGIMQAEIAEI